MEKSSQSPLFVLIFSIVVFFGMTINSQSAEEDLTEDSIRSIYAYMKDRYAPIIEKLREGEEVTRGEIFRLYDNDPSLQRRHDGGHDTFEHKHFPLSPFRVLARDDRQVDPGERRDTWKKFQIYLNVLKIHVLKFDGGIDYLSGLANYQKVRGTPGVWQNYWDIEEARFDGYYSK